MCHANEKEGDVIGVIDLKFSLDNSDVMISNTLSFIISIASVFVLLTLIAVWFVTKKVTDPLKELKHEMNEFFSFLANEKDSLEPFKVHSQDEIGEMVIALNENIDKTIKGLKKDAHVINEVGEVCKQAALGDMSVKIQSDTNNPEINNLTHLMNEMLTSINYRILRVLNVLNAYSQDEYTKKISTKDDTKAELRELFD